MDTDGVDVEVLYCEVSAYRYLYLLRNGSHEATRAFNDTLHDFASADPSRLVVTYQVPIHDIDVAIQEVQRIASMGGKSLQLPVFPAELGQADYFDERYDPLFAAIVETGLPMCCHIGLNTALDQLAARDPTPRLALTLSCTPPTACEALGIWLLTGILVRFPELKLVFVEPGLGWVAWYLHVPRRHGAAPGLRVPGAAGRAAELLLPPQHVDDLHRRARPGAPPPPRARHREPDVVERLPAPGVDVAEVARGHRGAARRPAAARPRPHGVGERRRASGTCDPHDPAPGTGRGGRGPRLDLAARRRGRRSRTSEARPASSARRRGCAPPASATATAWSCSRATPPTACSCGSR